MTLKDKVQKTNSTKIFFIRSFLICYYRRQSTQKVTQRNGINLEERISKQLFEY